MSVLSIPTNETPTERRHLLGLGLFLVSLGVGFLAMLILYGVLRAQMPAWPPPGLPPLPKGLPTINTIVVIASSLCMHAALSAARQARPKSFTRWLLATANLGALFIVLQGLLARQAIGLGIQAGTSTYGSLLFLLAGFHAAHLLVGLIALVVLGVTAARSPMIPNRSAPVRLWTIYWHFIGAVWLIMYVTLFLM